MPSVVLLSTAPSDASNELRELLSAAGFTVRVHALGSAPSIDFAPLSAAVIEVGTKPDAATAQTRRWRAELGDEFIPIVWVLASADADVMARGLDAGADVVLARPFTPAVFIAQMQSAARSRATTARVAMRAAESRLLGEQLNRALAQIEREQEAARRLRLAFLERPLPTLGSVRFAVCHRPRGRTAGDFYAAEVLDTDRVCFHIGDVIGPGGARDLLARFVAETVSAATEGGSNAGEVLGNVNHKLIRLRLDDQPLVAMLVGIINPRTGELEVARAGLPAPIHLPTEGEARAWAIPGPFLGTAESIYPTHTATLHPGDKLVLATDGTRPDGDPAPANDSRLAEASSRHRTHTGQAFVDAVARDLLAEVRHQDDFTLMSVDFPANATKGVVPVGE